MSQDILLNLIDPDPNQPRKYFDPEKINELAQSIQTNGLAVPILVRPAGERFVIVHGERRYKAALQLGRESIPAEVREIEADEARWLSLVENVQRSDLSPIEEAQAYQDALGQGMTQVALGERLGKTQSYIAQKIRLLKAPQEMRDALDKELVTEGHVRQLLRLADYPMMQRHLTVLSTLYYSIPVRFVQNIITRALDHITMVDLLRKQEWGAANEIFIRHAPFKPAGEDGNATTIKDLLDAGEVFVYWLKSEAQSRIKQEVSYPVWILVGLMHLEQAGAKIDNPLMYGVSALYAVVAEDNEYDGFFLHNCLNWWRPVEEYSIEARQYVL